MPAWERPRLNEYLKRVLIHSFHKLVARDEECLQEERRIFNHDIWSLVVQICEVRDKNRKKFVDDVMKQKDLLLSREDLVWLLRKKEHSYCSTLLKEGNVRF